MNTVLIVMVLVGRTWTPQYAVLHKTEIACIQAASKYPSNWDSTQKAVCVPLLQVTVQ